MRLTISQGSDQLSAFPPFGSETSSIAVGKIEDSAIINIGEIEFPRSLVLDKGLLRGSQSDRDSKSLLQEPDRPPNFLSNQNSTILCNPVAVERLLNEESEEQIHQLLSKIELMQEEALRAREKVANNLESLHMQIFELKSKTDAVQSLLKANKNFSEQAEFSNVDTKGSPTPLLTHGEVTELIRDEGERLMRTWGAQFDDLTVYLQDNLEKQRSSIAETRTSTFEHMDADAQRREEFWNSRWKEILSQNHQYDNWIHELREDQERSFLIIVDTLVSLKSKFQSISDRMDELEEFERKPGSEWSTIRQGLQQQLTSSQSKFVKYDAKLQSLKNIVDHAMKDIEEIAEDRESVQNILISSVELFNSKIDGCYDRWGTQCEGLEKRMKEKVDAGQKQIHNLNKHRREIEVVVTAMCKKMVDLSGMMENQRLELELLKRKTNDEFCLIDGQLLSHGITEGVHDDAIFKYMEVDQKKYKKILWSSRQKSGSLFGENHENEIEFYDLTFATSTE
jgi:mannitol/fructose-specific phosphotransferase system IIA component (Ntr-type)